MKRFPFRLPITAAQCRAARGLLHLRQEDLALIAGVGIWVVRGFEEGKRTHPRLLAKIQDALQQQDLVFPAGGVLRQQMGGVGHA